MDLKRIIYSFLLSVLLLGTASGEERKKKTLQNPFKRSEYFFRGWNGKGLIIDGVGVGSVFLSLLWMS
jgi:hypothetical protein